MSQSKVFFTDFRTHSKYSQLEKLRKLMRAAGMEDIDFDGKFTAIKLTFGEPGNLTYLRPNWAKVVADEVRRLGGRPFLTDCNTLYVGRRKHALEHLEAAMENGFSPTTTGCQLIIADGLKGTDDVEVPVVGGTYCKTAKIGRAIMDADILISLSHFKGHIATGFGGAIKNIGMGCGSRAGKMEQHNTGKPEVMPEKCRRCGQCAKSCGQNAIRYDGEGRAFIDQDACVGCGRCIGACNFDAIHNPNDASNAELCRKMAEYTKAVLDGRPHFHISLVMDISPYCDCHGCNDTPILPDVGIFASFDPVALDQACVDACLKQSPLPNSQLSDHIRAAGFKDLGDHFKNSRPSSEWRAALEHAEAIGLGSRSYELVTVY